LTIPALVGTTEHLSHNLQTFHTQSEKWCGIQDIFCRENAAESTIRAIPCWLWEQLSSFPGLVWEQGRV